VARQKDEQTKPRPLLCGAVHEGLLTGYAGCVKLNVGRLQRQALQGNARMALKRLTFSSAWTTSRKDV
jgi:hypothetical protein